MQKQVKCPYCGKPAIYAPENQYRPFCSERCQLIDLGDWATEKYAVPAEEVASPSTKNADSDDDVEND